VPASERGFTPNLLAAARKVNDSMPAHICELTSDAFEEAGLELNGANVTALGVAFKGNTADTRESPSISVIKMLKDAGAEILVHDPLVMNDDARFKALAVKRADTIAEAVSGSRAVLVLTDHLEYRGLTGASLKKMGKKLSVVVDARHILDPSEAVSAGLIYRGVGQVNRRR
jgi:UDP-N-acetyl-D-mannosaminuronic acid dehydrogenase